MYYELENAYMLAKLTYPDDRRMQQLEFDADVLSYICKNMTTSKILEKLNAAEIKKFDTISCI